MTNNKVTLTDVYNVVNRLEDKMDRRLTELENRVEKNESFRERAVALAGVVGAMVSVVATWLWDKVTRG